MYSIWTNANDGAVFLMKFGYVPRHKTPEVNVVVHLIAVGQPGQERARNVSQRMENKAIDNQTSNIENESRCYDYSYKPKVGIRDPVHDFHFAPRANAGEASIVEKGSKA